MVKNPPVNARGAGVLGLSSGSGRSPAVGNGNPLSSVLAWMIPWTKGHGRLQSIRSERSDASAAGYFRQAQMWQEHPTLHTLISCRFLYCISLFLYVLPTPCE